MSLQYTLWDWLFLFVKLECSLNNRKTEAQLPDRLLCPKNLKEFPK